MEQNISTRQKWIIALALIPCIKSAYFMVDIFKSIFVGSFNSFGFGSLQSLIFLFLLPYSIIQFYKGRQIGYILMLYYFIHFAALTTTNFIANYKYFGQLQNIITTLLFLILNICVLILLFHKTLLDKFYISKLTLRLIVFTALIIAVLVAIPYLLLLTLPAVLILAIIVIKWDMKVLKKNLQDDLSYTGKDLITTKFKMTSIPFLLLIPYYFFVSKPLLGSGVYSVDAWGTIYPGKSPYYEFSQEIFYSLPGIICFIWFQVSYHKLPELKIITKNYYWTVVLFYCILFSFSIINGLSKW